MSVRAGRLALLALLCLVPRLAWAQGGSITGLVKDTSGGVLPGVTVEATGPALLAPRTAESDTSGIYRIIDLPPSTYTVTFTLAGFNKVVREGVELTGTAVITIPVEMRVGAIEESVIVTGASPIVDVQTAKRETVLKGDVIESLPGTHAYGALLNAIPGVTVDNNGLANTPTMTFFTARGGNTNEGRMTINGMVVAASFNGGGVSSLAYDSNNVEEVSVVVAGVLNPDVMRRLGRSAGDRHGDKVVKELEPGEFLRLH